MCSQFKNEQVTAKRQHLLPVALAGHRHDAKLIKIIIFSPL